MARSATGRRWDKPVDKAVSVYSTCRRHRQLVVLVFFSPSLISSLLSPSAFSICFIVVHSALVLATMFPSLRYVLPFLLLPLVHACTLPLCLHHEYETSDSLTSLNMQTSLFIHQRKAMSGLTVIRGVSPGRKAFTTTSMPSMSNFRV